jgi:hypothetical protein
VSAPPYTGVAIVYGADRFWYDRGQWYRLDGAAWVVVGVFVPAPLPLGRPALQPFAQIYSAVTALYFGLLDNCSASCP